MPKGEPPREPGRVFFVTYRVPLRWKPYKPNSEQARRGITGRWQQMNEYGGWENTSGAGRTFPFEEWEEADAVHE